MKNNEDINRVREILEDYKNKDKKEKDDYIAAYQKLSKLDEGFELLLLNIELNISINNFESHWTRMPKEVLINYKILLFNNRKEILKKDDFSSLYRYIWEITKKESGGKKELNWIGPVVVYDTAFKIGIFLGFFPEKMYIFAGVKIGIESLVAIGIVDPKSLIVENFGPNYKIEYLVELPTIFKEANLEYYEHSNCWCKKRTEGAELCINSKNKSLDFKVSKELNFLFYEVFTNNIKEIFNFKKKDKRCNLKQNKVILKIENETKESIESKISKSKYYKYIEKFDVDMAKKIIKIIYKKDVYNA